MLKKVDEEQKLGEFLKEWFPDSSNATLRSWLKLGRILVDGTRAVRWDMELKGGEKVERLAKEKKIQGRVKELYRDQHLIVLDKPGGLLSVATDNEKEDTLHSILKQEFRELYVVHRLDKETSGVILFALNEKAFNGLKQLFKDHDIIREYRATLEGRLEPEEGTWDCFIYEDRKYKMHVSDNRNKGERAVTNYKVDKYGPKTTEVTFFLETGKKNQVRVQAAHCGHPILGDTKYGATLSPKARLRLRAVRLEFAHPITNKRMVFTVDA